LTIIFAALWRSTHEPRPSAPNPLVSQPAM
jgi:hypothetical protein